MIKIGMMIADRYEILEKIGTGGMSDVYKARCHKLNRYVAMKVLKQEFSENANFVSKFWTEAQAAAGLMHPNIVNVYDVGEESGIYYIVMELVEGITLKKYIEKKARLSYKEAVSIAIQVSMGIEAAHNNHIIHRDIKPQNIIISRDGKVKVTDFGIAKAATSNTITSNVMGSVHYTSPEQARGGYSDEKSDIYSLGITIFEMLTGRVPFNGDTTVAIAIRHIQEELPSPQEYVAEIPDSVAAIVMKCCQKSPDRRYQNMGELIADLKQSLITPDENFVVNRDPDSVGGTRMVPDQELQQIRHRSTQSLYEEEASMRLNTPQPRRRQRPPEREEEYYEEEYAEPEPDEYEEEEGDDDDDSGMERVTTVLAIVAGIIICIIIVILLGKIFGFFSFDDIGNRVQSQTDSTLSYLGDNPVAVSPTPGAQTGSQESTEESQETTEPLMITMINVEGWNAEDAKRSLMALGFLPVVDFEESDTVMAGTVIRADLAPDQDYEIDTEVHLVVSSGSSGVMIPLVVGSTYEEASSQLLAAGFLVNRLDTESAAVEAGRVITQNPTGEQKAPKGSTITLTVSLGVIGNKVQMPNLIGLSPDEAAILIAEAGLVYKSAEEVNNNEVGAGLVCYQNFSAGSYVDPGAFVEIKISKGAAEGTYWTNAVIEAPTSAEAPDYVPGSSVRITLVSDSGTSLLDVTTASFPQQTGNIYGITSQYGTITLYYTVTLPPATVTDPATGELVTTPGETQTRSVTRRIEFMKE